jgi:cyanate lyase
MQRERTEAPSKGLSWSTLAKSAERSEVWTTSALLGQQAISKEEAAAFGALLDLSAEEVAV